MSLPYSLLPDFIVKQYSQGHLHGLLQARTLFIDLSGFTALTETLMKGGNVGAEKLGGILNSIFSPLVKIIYEEGGFVPYFAGDAFTAIFPEKTSDKLKPVLQAALRIHHFFQQRHCQFEGFEIGYKMGLGRGPVEWGIVGEKLKSWYFRGPAIEQCIHCQTKAGPGQVIMQTDFVDRETESFHFTALPNQSGYLLLNTHINELTLSKPSEQHEKVTQDVFARAVSEFLPENLLNMQGEGEFRSVVSVFCAFRQIESHEQLHAFASVFLRRIHHYGGYFKEIDYGDKGGLMLAFFGAPVTYENNLQRALEFAWTVRTDWEEVFGESTYRMGITTGLSFTGLIGGDERCQYAAVGRHVNLAARLMAQAPWGSILTDEDTSKNKLFSFEYRGDIFYKGIAQPVPTFELLERKAAEEFPFEGPLVGREEELNRILQFAGKHWKKNKSGLVAILGEAGTGKSRLAWEACQALEGKYGATWLYGPADQILQKPFFPFVQLLRRFFGLKLQGPVAAQNEQFEHGFRQIFSQLKNTENIKELQRLEPAYRALLELPQPDERWEKLDSRSRHQNILAALQAFFTTLTEQGPCIIELEDLQSIDPESEDFLNKLIPLLKNRPALLLFSARYNEEGLPPALLKKELPLPLKIIELNSLPLKAMRSFAENKLKGPISEEFLQLLERTTNGNPFYLEQLIEYFRESQLLLRDPDGSWNILDQNVKLSHSIHAILTARLDRLSGMVRETVKAAAVIGREFELPVLAEVMQRHENFRSEQSHHLPEIVQEQVHTAEKVQIWRAVNELRYIFKHSLLREAVYEMQLRARLKQLHLLIAQAIEKIHSEKILQYLADLAYHYEQAGDLINARHYAQRAADFFRNNYQNRQALRYYDKLLKWVNPEDEFSEYFDLLMHKAEMLEMLGRWQEAEDICRKAYLEHSQKACLEHGRKALKVNLSAADSICMKARAANALGKQLLLRGKYNESKKHLSNAQQLFEKLDDLQGKIQVYGNLGNLYFRQGAYEDAKAYFIKSIALSRQNPPASNMAQIVANLGLAFMNQGRYGEGIHWMEEQLLICKREEDLQGMATLHVNLGILFFEAGKYEKAKEHYEQGLTLAEELSNKFLMAIALGSLGSIYQKYKKFEKARELYLRDLKLVEDMGDLQGKAITLLYMGELESLTSQYEQALQHLHESLEICKQLNYQKGIARAINTIGDVYYHLEKYQKALQHYEEAIRIAREISNLLVLSSSLYEKALTLQKMKRKEEAFVAAEESLAIAQKLQQKEMIDNAQKLIALLQNDKADKS